MKFKALLISIGIAAAVVGCGPQVAQQSEVTDVVDEVVIEESAATKGGAEEAVAETTVDPAALEEMLAQLSAENALQEVELDEAAMADFLEADMITTLSGLQFVVEKEGTGPIPAAGDVVQLHYTGKLADGTVFDSSYDRGEPIAFPLDRGFVIPGWDEGVGLLSVGSKAKFVVPPELAYAEYGVMSVIPPNATLYFEVELLDILPGSPEDPTTVAEADFLTTESGLRYYDLAEGDGVTPEAGQVVSVHYTGWLEDGTKFDSSLDRGMPMTFPVGAGYVLPGLDEGLTTMNVGGKRQLVIPAELAYGEAGAADVIPPDTTLIVEVELLEVQS